jgi:RND family efflux transporter MFP subunit
MGLTGTVQAQAPAALVQIDTVRIEPLAQTVPIIGRLVARQAGTIATRINGPVAALRVEIGDRIKTGQIVAVLDTAMLTVQRDLTQARVAESQAALKTRKAELALAQQDVKRLARLKDSAATTRAAFDDALQAEVIAHAQVAEAQASIATARANLRLVQINLDDAEIRAPYGGVVVQRLTEAGSYVKIGDDIVRIVADQSLEVEADVPFERLAGLTPGTVTAMALDDGTVHHAIVRAIIPEENNRTRTRAVRFAPKFGTTHNPLAVDQSVTLQIPIGVPRPVLSVHKDAVIQRGGNSIVYVVQEDTAQIRTIQLGESVGSRFEVVSGLSEGDVVVIRGNERLRPNDKVQIAAQSS